MSGQKKDITLKLSRYKPGIIDPPRFQTYRLTVGRHMTVLDCLERIRLQQDRTLMYRHSCHHSSCGTCACLVNGSEALACTTRVWEMAGSDITVEPLKGFERIADLVVDMTGFYSHFRDDWTVLQPVLLPVGDLGAEAAPPFTRFENCIECGCCVSACPPFQEITGFMGPAALAAIHAEMRKSPEKKAELLTLAAGPQGERRCRRHLACSRVCPTAVYPARRIADLRRILASR